MHNIDEALDKQSLVPELNTPSKTVPYLLVVVVVVASLVGCLDVLPDSYWSYKKNIFNVWFVKYGWLWTVGLVLPVWLVVRCVEQVVNSTTTFSPLAKTREIGFGLEKVRERSIVCLLLATICWFCFTSLFDFIELSTGECVNTQPTTNNQINTPITSVRVCKRTNGFEWTGIDVSGHCFLLSLSSLLLWEFSYLPPLLLELATPKTTTEQQQPTPMMTPTTTTPTTTTVPTPMYPSYTNNNNNNNNTKANSLPPTKTLLWFARATQIIWFFVRVLWFVMLIATCVYFHSLSSKLVGTMFGFVAWFVSFQAMNLFLSPAPKSNLY